MGKPKISVVTAVLNGKDFVRDTVESVLAQKGDFELEYIIRDGGSTDGTLEILGEYKDKCTIVSEKDGSPQAAINSGMEMATGDIGCWLNADDLFENDALQSVVQMFNTYDVQWLYGKCRIIDENNFEIRKPVTLYKNLLGFFYSRNILLCENYINQPATFWKMDLWRKTGGLNTDFKAAFDYDLWLKMADESKPVHIRRYLARFRRHSTSISENNYVRQFQEELDICKKRSTAFHYLIHKLNYLKIVTIYKLLSSS